MTRPNYWFVNTVLCPLSITTLLDIDMCLSFFASTVLPGPPTPSTLLPFASHSSPASSHSLRPTPSEYFSNTLGIRSGECFNTLKSSSHALDGLPSPEWGRVVGGKLITSVYTGKLWTKTSHTPWHPKIIINQPPDYNLLFLLYKSDLKNLSRLNGIPHNAWKLEISINIDPISFEIYRVGGKAEPIV